MGKKDKQGLKRKREEESDEDEADPELQAELNALMSMRAEKGLVEDVAVGSTKANNKDGLLRALEGVGASQLSFKESMQLCQFDLEVEDENDDLAREVAKYAPLHVFLLHNFTQLRMIVHVAGFL